MMYNIRTSTRASNGPEFLKLIQASTFFASLSFDKHFFSQSYNMCAEVNFRDTLLVIF